MDGTTLKPSPGAVVGASAETDNELPPRWLLTAHGKRRRRLLLLTLLLLQLLHVDSHDAHDIVGHVEWLLEEHNGAIDPLQDRTTIVRVHLVPIETQDNGNPIVISELLNCMLYFVVEGVVLLGFTLQEFISAELSSGLKFGS